MILDKMRKLAKKTFNKKTYLLMVINRFVPESFGKILDIEINREEKNLFLLFHKAEEEATLHLHSYAIIYKVRQPYLVFKSIEKTGYFKSMFPQLSHTKEIAIEHKYVEFLKRLI